MKRKHKLISLWIEWKDEDASDALIKMLINNGACLIEVDNDVDIESYHSPGIKNEHTVFRIRVGDDYPIWSLLTDIATHPGVYSVGEI
ncbi:MAG: hypothetical protein IJS94_02965 [Clostridia bacterium]|nr:hypothetical protein [Clostridia bacterium]